MALPALEARLAAAFGSPVADEILIRPRSRRRGSSSSVSAFAPLAPLSRRRLRRLTASEERRIDGVASGVSHVRLRESLRRLGRSVVAAETEAETEVSLTSASEGATARRGGRLAGRGRFDRCSRLIDATDATDVTDVTDMTDMTDMTTTSRLQMVFRAGFAVLSLAVWTSFVSSSSESLAQEVLSSETLLASGPLDEIAFGDEDAPILAIEYASMTCPHCAAFHLETWPSFREEFVDSGQVRFLFREMPFDPLSLAAFMLVRCAPSERADALIGGLFSSQSSWTSREKDSREELFRTARQAGFTESSFDSCLADESLAEGILAVQERGVSAGVSGTPTFFFGLNDGSFSGGTRISGNQSLDVLRAVSARLLSSR